MTGLILFIVSCFLVGAVLIWRRSSFIEAPVLVALLAGAWMIPQGLRIEQQGQFADLVQDYFWAYATACFLMFAFGFWSHKKSPVWTALKVKPRQYSEKSLQVSAIAMVVLGAASYRIAGGLASAEQLSTQWTGPATLFFMFGQLLNWGFCISVLLFLRKRSWLNLAIICLASILIMLQMAGYIKRNAVFELAAIVGGSLYLVRGWRPSLAILATAILCGTLLIHEVGAIRGYSKQYNVSTFEAISSGAVFSAFEKEDSVSTTEFTQAIADVDYTRRSLNVDFGASYWDKLVHRWVPAFLTSRQFKESLKINPRGLDAEMSEVQFFGATRTGFSDTFRSFWIFGCFVFLAIGRFLGGLYRKAHSGDMFHQYLYLVILNDALIAFTEATSRFLVGLPWTYFVGYIVFFVVARLKRSSGAANAHFGSSTPRLQEP